MAKKLSAFPWYGGKYSKLSWLLPLLPACHHYCEPFGGSAAVLLNREPSPIETYNDLDGEVVNFFRVLREQREALIAALELTPYAREERRIAVSGDVPTCDIERARRFYVRVRHSFAGKTQTTCEGDWRFARTATSGGMAVPVRSWLGGIASLASVSSRLLRVQVESAPALDVIRRYDSPDTLLYVDPPYVRSSRSAGSRNVYASEMQDDDHEALAQALRRAQGKVALSGYACTLYDRLYSDWNRVDVPCYSAAGHVARTEVLWTNYDPSEREEVAA